MSLSRRHFFQMSAAVTAGFAGLRALGSSAQANPAPGISSAKSGRLNADPEGIFDLAPGFSYTVVSMMGDRMSDGLLVPGRPDGMACFTGRGDRVVLVRNHELLPQAFSEAATGPNFEYLDQIDSSKIYDNGSGKPCGGGTSHVIFDTKKQEVVDQRLSLMGTVRNCAGGPTPWNSWITCEESVNKAGEILVEGQQLEKDHGYNFEVPAILNGELAAPVPLADMGRFNHEAVAVDPLSGIVYQTEDRHDGLIYRFIPNTPGRLEEGGKLQALVVKGKPSLDTRNWDNPGLIKPGDKMEVEWIDIEDVEAPQDDLRFQGFEKGAARFARGEGMWYGKGEVYFACTNGGEAKKGQVWRYTPSEFEGTTKETESPGIIELFVEPNDGTIIENADNLTVAPWGDIIVCEDGSGPDQFLLGINQKGEVYKLGRNAISASELAGVCFSPDGSTLFVNIQHNGITLAITGPWPKA